MAETYNEDVLEQAKAQLREKDRQLISKERELTQCMNEYYTFDLGAMKTDLVRLMGRRQEETRQTKDDRLKELAASMGRAQALGREHVSKGGSNYKIERDVSEGQIIQQFEAYSEIYEEIVKKANIEKQGLRREIADMESQLRSLRNIVGNKQVENKKLAFLLDKEEALKDTQTEYQIKALKSLNKTLAQQLSTLETQGDKLFNKVTPYGMEIVLEEKYKTAQKTFQKF